MEEVRVLSAMSSGDLLAMWRGARSKLSNGGDDGADNNSVASTAAAEFAKQEL